MTYVLGIDLGTTNSCMAILEGGEPVVLENGEGGRTTPSVVAITRHQERLIGHVARRQAITNAENTVFSIKRFMGRKFAEPDVQRSRALVPYDIVATTNGDTGVQMAGALYAPPQISAMILAKLKGDAEERLGEPMTRAVITVPAYFNDAQRQATKDAGQIAGLEVLRIINEPTSAALAYGFGNGSDEMIAVYDLGGGTFDISILQLGDGIFEVKSTNGDTHLGGDDFDAAIINWLAEAFLAEHELDLRTDAVALQRLKEAAEKAKIELSALLQTEIHLPFVAAAAQGPLHLSATLTRSTLEALVAPLIEATMAPCRQAMLDAEVTPEEIDAVILVGGQTRMPAVVAEVRAIFGKEPKKGVNPDEVVAVGAAIQAGALTGAVDNVLLLDVTPLTLGVETHGGTSAALIPRNSTVPTMRSEIFTTGADDQDSVEIHITQGERVLAAENKSLARFHLDGIPPAPRGVPQIEVTFTLDADGILSVAAQDLGTGHAQRVTVAPSSGLSPQDVEAMVREAETYRDSDRVRGEEVALLNAAETLLHTSSRLLRDGLLADDAIACDRLQTLTAGLQSALPTRDLPQIRERVDRLQMALDALRAQSASAPAIEALPLTPQG